MLTIQKRYDMENDDNQFSSWTIKIGRQDESAPVNLGRLNISTNVLTSQEKTCAKYTAIQIFRKLGTLFVLIPVNRVREDVCSDAFVIDLLTNDVFKVIALPDLTRVQFSTGATGDGGFERGNNCANRPWFKSTR